jgi:hypothetical protein
MAILVDHPWLAACVGGLLLGPGRWRRQRLPIIVGGLWLFYSLYETGMKRRSSGSGECNFRIDLILLYPLLLLATMTAVISLLRPAGNAGAAL